MLKIIVPGVENFDNIKEEFVTTGDVVLELEHSLASVSKWESVWEKAFLGEEKKTTEETLDYVRLMTNTEDINSDIFDRFSKENYSEIDTYINAKMTATWFSDAPSGPKNKNVLTAELIYYWLVEFNIPFECEHWHLNKLFTLIKVCNVQNSKPKKMGQGEAAQRNRELNARRKEELGTTG